MSRIVYIGQTAGLRIGDECKAGDMNSPFDYVLICSCSTTLGPLGRFIENSEGFRSAYCPICGHATIVDKRGQVQGRFKANLKMVGEAVTRNGG